MRGAPHVGFSATMRKIKSRTSLVIVFLPARFLTLEITFQYEWKPARCHRTTVSGVTTIRACVHLDQTRRAAIQNNLSERPSLGRGCLRLKTANCCLRAKFSSSRFRRERKQRIRSPNQSRTKQSMSKHYNNPQAENTCKPLISLADRILAKDTASAGYHLRI